ncbi:MAG TPA: zinc ribbon domain-containing protein [Methanoregulaceae archaeon]|nr:zinc ribbon domain-containing protein [Methanoregulaceae archaeon]HPW10171.1 zinc ribbon domain-containing protein [Methanoregulaceae archaeon]
MPFCQDCGARLEEGSRFCTDCGAPVLDVPGSGPAVPADSDSGQGPIGVEKVIAVIPNLMKVRGLFFKGPSWHHLVVTSERIIVVHKTVKGLSRIKQDIGVIGPDYEYSFMKSMKPERIREENPESQVIPLGDLVSITVSKFVSYSTEDGTEAYWQVLLTTKKEALNLRTDYHEDPGEYFRDPALMQLLGERLILQDI